jgi:catalase
MAYKTDFAQGQNIHVNYEPSFLGGVKEAERPGKEYTPRYEANLVRQKISRTNDFKQAGETYRNFEDWERDELIMNLSNTLAACDQRIQDRMIEHFTLADQDYGRRVAEGIKQVHDKMMKAKTEVTGTDGPIGNTSSREGVEQAETNSHSARPY